MENLTRVCCVCGKIWVNGQWVEGPQKEFMVSHGYCTECKNHAMVEIRKIIEEDKANE